MNDKNPAAEWLRTQGVPDETITAQLAYNDQNTAWISDVAPLARTIHDATTTGDWPRAAHMGAHLSEKLLELDIDLSSRAAGIIVTLLSDCAAAVAKLDELGASF